jgi:hypothetical protein
MIISHGEAALMLCECLILLLIEKEVISKDEAGEVLDSVIEVSTEFAESSRASTDVTSISLLLMIARSISAAADP